MLERILKRAIRYIHEDTELDLRSNQIDAEQAKLIAEELILVTDVGVNLDLGQNIIGDVGAAAIADALRTSQSLETLWLTDNRIGDAGMAALAQVLKQGSSLRKLCLSRNQIGTVGLTLFAHALKVNKGLTSLLLNDCSITEEGAKMMAACLKSNSTLATLSLEGNDIGDEGAMEILNVLKKHNTSVTCLLLDDNAGISPTIISAIRRVVEANEAGARYVRKQIESHTLSTIVPLSHDLPPQAKLTAPPVAAITTEAQHHSLPSSKSIQCSGPPSLVASHQINMRLATKPNQTALSLPTPLVPDPPTPSNIAASANCPEKQLDSKGSISVNNEWLIDLPKQRAELEFEIHRLTSIRAVCSATPDEDQWETSAEAEKRIHRIQEALMIGKYPTREELERMISELNIKIRDKVRNGSVAAAMPLRSRLAQLQTDLAREVEAEERVRQAINKGTEIGFIAVGRPALSSVLPTADPSDKTGPVAFEYLAPITVTECRALIVSFAKQFVVLLLQLSFHCISALFVVLLHHVRKGEDREDQPHGGENPRSLAHNGGMSSRSEGPKPRYPRRRRPVGSLTNAVQGRGDDHVEDSTEHYEKEIYHMVRDAE
jgi:Leucine Rich repeat